MAEQRHQSVLAVIGEGGTVTEVASRWGVSRQSVHGWLSRYERGGLEGLADRSHRPSSCPHQMDPQVEAVVLEMRRVHRSWGARRIAFELGRRDGGPVPSESGIYRALLRAGLIEPGARRRREEEWRRRENHRPGTRPGARQAGLASRCPERLACPPQASCAGWQGDRSAACWGDDRTWPAAVDSESGRRHRRRTAEDAVTR